MLDLNFKPDVSSRKKGIGGLVLTVALAILVIVLFFMYNEERKTVKSLEQAIPTIEEVKEVYKADTTASFDPRKAILRGIIGKDTIRLILLEDLNSAGYILRDGDVVSNWEIRYEGGDSVSLTSLDGKKCYILKLGGGIREKVFSR